MTKNPPPPIPKLISDTGSSDLAVAAPAARQLLERHNECRAFLPDLIKLLANDNAAIADIAFRTVERVGSPSVPALTQALPGSGGRFRHHLLGLITQLGDFDDFYPILEAELAGGSKDGRYWAANCLGRAYAPNAEWPDHARATLEQCAAMLLACRNGPDRTKHWAQARMTLKHLGIIPLDAA